MAATAGYSRPQPGPEGETPGGRGHGGHAPSAGLNQGVHVVGADPSAAHPHLLTSRPVIYIQAPPPPPPFMHYQWPPLPFYNPFTPFSGMGYGMMMPPFPPTPYMDTPAYFLPHAPLQPMDYRRMTHPQPHANPPTAPYSNPAPYLNPTRRPRPPQPHPVVRETVNSEVQTDPARSSPLRSCSDSGRDTELNSPTSSTSSYRKKSSVDGDNYSRSKESLQLRIACTRNANLRNPDERQNIPKTGKENVPLNSPVFKNPHFERQETVETVNPSDKEMNDKERRVSVPDILMSWTPQEDKMSADKNKLPSYEDEAVNFQSSTVVNEDALEEASVEDKEDSKAHYEHSLNISIKVCNNGNETLNEASMEEPSESVSSCKFKRKLNESIWSVESLPVFIPAKEWLVQNTTADVILEEEAQNGGRDEEEEVKDDRKNRSSSTDSVQMTDSFIGFSTPANKPSGVRREAVIAKIQKQLDSTICKLTTVDAPICKLTTVSSTTNENDVGSSEPGANSPNQRSFTIEEQNEATLGSDKQQEEKAEEKAESSELKKDLESDLEKLSLPLSSIVEVSPGRGQLVDCGIQCSEIQDFSYKGNAGANRKHYRPSDAHNLSTGKPEGFFNGQKKRPYRNKGQERPYGQQEVFYGNCGKPGKPRGGKGRY